MNIQIPRHHESVLLDDGVFTTHWYRYLEQNRDSTALVASLASGKIWIGSAANLPAEQTMSGDATISTAGALTIANDAVTNAKLANMAAATVKGQIVGAATTDPVDLTAAQLVTIINTADGAGSLLDADFLDGLSSLAFIKADGTVALTADWDAGSFEIRAQTFESDVVTGTAPLVVASTTKVANLNADLLDDQSGAYYLDSANFTGTNWTDLTDAGETTLHTHAATSITNFHALIAAHVALRA